MSDIDEIFKELQNSFFDSIYDESYSSITDAHGEHKRNADGNAGEHVSGKYRISKVVKNNKLQISYSGQKLMNLEFGKGELSGKSFRSAYGTQKELASSKLLYKVERSPWRRAGVIRREYTGKHTKGRLVTVERKKSKFSAGSTKYTKVVTRRKYRTITEGNSLFKLYSRPGEYRDMDGVKHKSSAKGVYPLEPKGDDSHKKDKLSIPGSYAISAFWGYNFLKCKQVDRNIFSSKAYKEFRDDLIYEIGNYLCDDY